MARLENRTSGDAPEGQTTRPEAVRDLTKGLRTATRHLGHRMDTVNVLREAARSRALRECLQKQRQEGEDLSPAEVLDVGRYDSEVQALSQRARRCARRSKRQAWPTRSSSFSAAPWPPSERRRCRSRSCSDDLPAESEEA